MVGYPSMDILNEGKIIHEIITHVNQLILCERRPEL